MRTGIIVIPEAEADVAEAFQWYEEMNPGLGAEFLRCIDAALNLIKRNPGIYRKVYKDIRRALPQRFPYEIFYLTDGDKIIVLAVLHAKRNPDLLKERTYRR